MSSRYQDDNEFAQWVLQQFSSPSASAAGGAAASPVVKPSAAQKMQQGQYTDTGTGDRFYQQGRPSSDSVPHALSPDREAPSSALLPLNQRPVGFFAGYTEDFLEPLPYRGRKNWQKDNNIQQKLFEIGTERAKVALPKAEIAAQKMENARTNLGLDELRADYQREQSAVRPYARELDQAEAELRSAAAALDQAVEQNDLEAYRAAYLKGEQAAARFLKARDDYGPAVEKYSQASEKYWDAYNVFEKARDNYQNKFSDFSRPTAMAERAWENLKQNGQQYEVPEEIFKTFTELYKTGRIDYNTFANAVRGVKNNPSYTLKDWENRYSR